MSKTFNLSAIFNLKDRITSPIKKIKKRIDDTSNSFKKSAHHLNEITIDFVTGDQKCIEFHLLIGFYCILYMTPK